MKNKTKKELVYTALKRQITSGRLMPGIRLIEMELAARHDTSRTVVREVIKQLAVEGLVDLIPYRGGTVSRISLIDIQEAYQIQAGMEGLAAYLATLQITDKDIEQLEQIHKFLLEYLIDDVYEFQQWNRRFHRFFLRHCGNSRLLKLVESQRDQFGRHWYLVASIPDIRARSAKEHAAMIESVRARDADKTRFLMEEHVKGAAENLLKILKNVYPTAYAT
ncbi:MAG: GntR family transcriptional regulator [Proteobacteria bacterium]|nr:GntR family transcriptional regulator [Pseudomonadota bacterium]